MLAKLPDVVGDDPGFGIHIGALGKSVQTAGDEQLGGKRQPSGFWLRLLQKGVMQILQGRRLALIVVDHVFPVHVIGASVEDGLLSGKRAEDEVAHSLTFVDRPFFRDFRNVYVADQVTETEIDNVILTNNGIIVVEVKSAKHNITIGEDGRLLYSNSESYHNESIGDKMSAKRRLLKARIESKLRERGLDIPVHIDSYLVFVTPKRLEVTITDNFRQEHWCRRGRLQHIVNNFISDVTYTAEEYAQLEEIIDGLDCNIRRFPTELDLPAIRDSFVVLYDLITEKPVVSEVKPQDTHSVKTQPTQTRKATHIEPKKSPSPKWNVINIAASAAIVLVASVAAVTAAVRSAS